MRIIISFLSTTQSYCEYPIKMSVPSQIDPESNYLQLPLCPTNSISFLDYCNSSPTGFMFHPATPPANSVLNGAISVILLKAGHILLGLTVMFQICWWLINSLGIKPKVLIILAYTSLHDLPAHISFLASSPYQCFC